MENFEKLDKFIQLSENDQKKIYGGLEAPGGGFSLDSGHMKSHRSTSTTASVTGTIPYASAHTDYTSDSSTDFDGWELDD